MQTNFRIEFALLLFPTGKPSRLSLPAVKEIQRASLLFSLSVFCIPGAFGVFVFPRRTLCFSGRTRATQGMPGAVAAPKAQPAQLRITIHADGPSLAQISLLQHVVGFIKSTNVAKFPFSK